MFRAQRSSSPLLDAAGQSYPQAADRTVESARPLRETLVLLSFFGEN